MIDYRHATLCKLQERRTQLEPALKHQNDGWEWSHIYEGVAAGRLSFWWNDSSSAVLELRQYPGCTALHIFIAGGTTEGLLDLYQYVAEYGRKYGVRKMTTLCRQGFSKKLPQHGWTTKKMIWYEKEL